MLENSIKEREAGGLGRGLSQKRDNGTRKNRGFESKFYFYWFRSGSRGFTRADGITDSEASDYSGGEINKEKRRETEQAAMNRNPYHTCDKAERLTKAAAMTRAKQRTRNESCKRGKFRRVQRGFGRGSLQKRSKKETKARILTRGRGFGRVVIPESRRNPRETKDAHSDARTRIQSVVITEEVFRKRKR